MEEEWRDVPGYEGFYQVSNLGRVKSMPNRSNHKGSMILSLSVVNGYMHVGLSKNAEQKICKVHRLVAAAFISNPRNLPQVNHKNGNKSDNRVENLEWVTAKENTKHAHLTGLAHAQKGVENSRSLKIVQLSMDGEEIARYVGTREAERKTGAYHSNISRCLNGKARSAGGFKWKLG